ncbi:MAG: hypothetical protein H0X62_13095, partial [Bacteroidetes bacterium]|nr:hypothetical protein [Bacteroidota bacterium]
MKKINLLRNFLPAIVFAFSNLFFCQVNANGFVKNEGQSINKSAYILQQGKHTAFFNAIHVTYQFIGTKAQQKSGNFPDWATAGKETDEQILIQNIKLEFLNANPNTSIKASGESGPYSNYFVKGKQITNVKHYNEIVYDEIYPNINLKYYLQNGNLKYDYILKPGADVNDIKLKYSGFNDIQVTKDGSLKVTGEAGALLDMIPECYQMINGQKQLIKADFILLDENIAGFILGKYNPNYELVIDPVLIYSTFFGGSSQETALPGKNMFKDLQNNILVTGMTSSLDFPTTPGTLQSSNFGQFDVFVSKLSDDGKNLIFSTYIGGSKQEQGASIMTNSLGEIVLVGNTFSDDFPVTNNALQSNFGGNSDGFILKLTPAGNFLVYASYIG